MYDAFVQRLIARVQELTIGDGQKGVDLGPMISHAAVEKVRTLLLDAVELGAQIRLGEIPKGTSQFVSPVILTGGSQESKIWSTEIFGPVVSITPFDTDAEAIAMANDTSYGLAAYLFTESTTRAWRISEALQFGMVGVNTGRISTAQAPFGGIKQSGMGREGGRYGLEEYLQLKYHCHELG